ncbi:MFS transporter [Sphingorhabdus lacus]|uniref:MFS transporter n=1 Tax=Sphingorhabdus lacus TaxID=392610 RepID=A0A6I6L258_9SPHN|nr:MFS transporter [Sphingorhabdus lacus]QGY79289.1 MFS transporter [Sphingorhabdus lacus]
MDTHSRMVDTTHQGMPRKAAFSSAMGSVLEWLDFTAYGVVSATVFPKLFFPTLDPNSALLASFATFGVGFFARPAGGVLFGLLGDRIGRKQVLMITFLLMGFSSLLIGLMPPYAVIGIWAPILIVALRFMQGFALGGEATGAQLFTMEHAPADKRGLFGSFINLAAPASQVLANGLLFAIAATMSELQFESFGWRIPFLLSIFLIVLGAYIRTRVTETPAFKALKERQSQIRSNEQEKSDRKNWPTIIRLILFWAAPCTCYYVVTVFSISYLGSQNDLPKQTIFLCLMAANAVAVCLTLAGGYASDQFGRKPALITAALVVLAVMPFYFSIMNTGNALFVFAAMSLVVGAIQAQSGILPAFFAEQFPTSSRYSGSALAYTGANLIFAGPTPFVATWVMHESRGGTYWLTAICMALIVISFAALLASPETRYVDINAPE